MLHKDLALDQLAEVGNVAQFVAFRPASNGRLEPSTSRVTGYPANHIFDTVGDAVSALLRGSAEAAINIRSYLPDDPRSREFVYRITSVESALAHLDRLSNDRLHLILNETVDVEDGGVSGVAQGELVEFAPDDTPRAVEKPGIASLPRDVGLAMLQQVYGVPVSLPGARHDRIEFSVHPRPRGWRQTHVLLWEIEPGGAGQASPAPSWPNRFSRHIGDKAFGLLMAQAYGAKVPSTIVVSRRVAPFIFGTLTGSNEIWTRTCPREPRPGLYTTTRGWTDPFALLQREDGDGEIASVLAQRNVRARYAGAAIVGADRLIIEGREGDGDELMVGRALPQPLPNEICRDVEAAHGALAEHLGPVRIEWVHDGEMVWVLQLHVGETGSQEGWITPGEAEHWVTFDVSQGLSALRAFVTTIPGAAGLILEGDIGLTSHLADVVRKWNGPARVHRAGA